MQPYQGALATFASALLTACAASQTVEPGVVFEPHELVTGSARSQAVLCGSFLGGATRDLAVVSVLPSLERRVRVYALEGGTWAQRVDAPLRRGVTFVDVARVAGRDRLITHAAGRVSWFDPDGETERPLVAFAESYRPTNPGEVPHVDVTRDLNGDGRDDLVIPSVDGFWISAQSDDGTFPNPVKLGPPEPFRNAKHFEHQSTYGEVGITAQTVPWYLSRVHAFDYDLDGREDLVFWDANHFDVHLQQADGSFDPAAKTFGTGVPFDYDGIYTHAFGYGDESELALLFGLRKKSRRTVLHSFRDVNGDGVADLITHSLEGRSLVKLSSSLGVHLGEAMPGGTRFETKASTRIRPGGSQPLGYAIHRLDDLDGDGRLELLVMNVDAGVGDMFQALVANSIDVDLLAYRLENGAYAEDPAAERRVRPDSHFFDDRGPFFPTVLLGDVNGDGLADLVTSKSWEELHLYVGVPGPDLIAEEPHSLEFDWTANEADARMVDLNGDGKKDVLVHHHPRGKPHRLTMLITG